MEDVSLPYAKEHLEDLVARATSGEDVRINMPGKATVRLVLVDEPPVREPRRLGHLAGTMKVPARLFEAMSEDSLAATVAESVIAHPDEWSRYCGGDDKLAGFFTGLVMKATKGQANGKAVAAELRRLRV